MDLFKAYRIQPIRFVCGCPGCMRRFHRQKKTFLKGSARQRLKQELRQEARGL